MRCYSHLSDDEREQIGFAKALGHSIGAIAQAIGRPKSTISRELSRNKLPSGRYLPLHAAGAYQLRRRREALIERDRALGTFVVDRLAEGWYPGANFRLAEGRKRTSFAGRELRDDLRLPASQ
jgi:IS30 family transposase